MPTYPAYPQHRDSKHTDEQTIESERGSNGALHVRVLGAAKRNFVIKHVLTLAESDALVAFCATNIGQLIAFTYAENGQLYSACIVAPPGVDRTAGSLRTVTVQLKEA
jgi:hypothetical protein